MVSVRVHINRLAHAKRVNKGALGSWGAALLEPYADKPDQSGTLLYSPDEIATRVGEYWDDFQVVRRLPFTATQFI